MTTVKFSAGSDTCAQGGAEYQHIETLRNDSIQCDSFDYLLQERPRTINRSEQMEQVSLAQSRGTRPLQPQLTYVRDPLKHEFPTSCNHEGPCGLDDTQANCACAINRTWCFADCGCHPTTCKRMFQGCQCLSRCDGRRPRRQISFDCIPGRCGCATCGKDPSPKLPRLSVRPSIRKIHNQFLEGDLVALT